MKVSYAQKRKVCCKGLTICDLSFSSLVLFQHPQPDRVASSPPTQCLNGVLTPQVCRSPCTPPALNNGNFACLVDGVMRHGTSCPLTCNAGYTPTSTASVSCDDGVFTPSTLPTCLSPCSFAGIALPQNVKSKGSQST